MHTVEYYYGEREKDERENMRIAIIGARAEATMPEWIWRQVAVNAKMNGVKSLEIAMYGPMVGTEGDRNFDWEDESCSQLSLSHFCGLFHEDDQGESRTFDCYVCFHPGCGQEAWKASWTPSLKMMLASGKCRNRI